MGTRRLRFLLALRLVIMFAIGGNGNEAERGPCLCLGCFGGCCLFMGSCLLARRTRFLTRLFLQDLFVITPFRDVRLRTCRHLTFLTFQAFSYIRFWSSFQCHS